MNIKRNLSLIFVLTIGLFSFMGCSEGSQSNPVLVTPELPAIAPEIKIIQQDSAEPLEAPSIPPVLTAN